MEAREKQADCLGRVKFKTIFIVSKQKSNPREGSICVRTYAIRRPRRHWKTKQGIYFAGGGNRHKTIIHLEPHEKIMDHFNHKCLYWNSQNSSEKLIRSPKHDEKSAFKNSSDCHYFVGEEICLLLLCS